MNDNIQPLLALQTIDLEIDGIQSELSAIPAKIKAIQGEIEADKKAFEEAKKTLVGLQVAKKGKDLELETQENLIRKHTGELNAVKTNEAYKALLGEIEKAKRDSSVLEDEILQLMEQVDQANKIWKAKEADAQQIEGGKRQAIADLEKQKNDLEAKLAGINSGRKTAVEALAPKISELYERIRSNKKKGAVLVPVLREQCSGCHMKVSQNSINEIRRGQAFITCDNCSRILYLEQVPADPSTRTTA